MRNLMRIPYCSSKCHLLLGDVKKGELKFNSSVYLDEISERKVNTENSF